MVINKLKSLGQNQDLWMAAFSIRQPRNSAGDIVITKIHETLGRELGNVEKTNIYFYISS